PINRPARSVNYIAKEMDVKQTHRNPESIRATTIKMMPLLRYDQLMPARCATRSERPECVQAGNGDKCRSA
ncbi:MAG: hypothetical protein WAU59_07235, partial [Rhodoplanes sp.]